MPDSTFRPPVQDNAHAATYTAPTPHLPRTPGLGQDRNLYPTQNPGTSLVVRAMNGIVQRIIVREYTAYLPPQDQLAIELGMSRTVIREALSMLVARHMIDMRPKIGTRILPVTTWRVIDETVVNWSLLASPDEAFVRDLVAFRTAIEPHAAASAAEHATPYDLAAIRTTFEDLAERDPSTSEYQTAIVQFHTRLLQASGNRFYRQTTAAVRSAILVRSPASSPARDHASINRHRMTLELTRDVVRAIEARDSAAAHDAMSRLIENDSDDMTAQPVSPTRSRTAQKT